jgi:hypothetical protein
MLKSECQHVDSTGECSLIQRLKELQAQKKEVDKQIKDYERNSCSMVDNFIKLLAEMERAGCFIYCNDRLRRDYSSGVRKHFEYHGTSHLEYALGSFSENGIQLICNELKDLSNKVNIIAEKQKMSNKLAEEIKEIKDTLGIE